MFYFCIVKKKLLGYGVMVTLQILVLSFLVRIQVAQLNDSLARVVFFCVVSVGRGWWSHVVRLLLVLPHNDASISRGSINSPAKAVPPTTTHITERLFMVVLPDSHLRVG